MSKINFKVNLSPRKAADMIIHDQDAEIVHDEINDLGNEKYFINLVFEKYYFRSSNRAALVVNIDNINGETKVRAIATGSSQGVLFNFDWGAADNFVESVRYILQDYII